MGENWTGNIRLERIPETKFTNKKQNMNVINFNQEWNFIVTETHGEKPSKTNLAKREILFFLQILLAKIGLANEVGGIYFLRQNYSALKEIYFIEK